MMHKLSFSLCFLFGLVAGIYGQTTEVFDDFEGNGNILTWAADDCLLNPNFANPFVSQQNPSATVLRYQDVGGQYANVRFSVLQNFDLSEFHVFSLKIYVPSSGLSGNAPNQVSLKLQNGQLAEPWTTQSEIIKPLVLDEWQTITFNFQNDNFINLDPGSLPPTLRSDFNRVLIQVNGENNNDEVLAFVDDIQLAAGQSNPYVYNQLVWSDEFDTPGPIDPTKWFPQTRLPQGDSWFNGEIQHYTDELDNSFVENGFLKIVARRQNYTSQGVTKQFTSARLNSKFAFTYGRVEIRAKLPTGPGTWPAMWTLGKNVDENGAYWQTQGYGTTGWPACGELDIMEHWGTNQDYVSSAIHTPSSFGATVNYGGRFLQNASTEFHDYTMIWSPEKIEFKVDGVTHYTYNPEIKDASTWPFDLDQYILLNVAILPSISPSFTQSALEIDYIRIYQEGVSGTNEVARLNSTTAFPNPFDNTLTIFTDQPEGKKLIVDIVDGNGRSAVTRRATVANGQFQISGLAGLPGGQYVIRYVVGQRQYAIRAVKW